MNLPFEFIHPTLGREIRAIGGAYCALKEGRLMVGGREVLYFVMGGQADTSCCGCMGFAYAMVPGVIVRGPEVAADGISRSSLVEPITDPGVRGEVEKLLADVEGIREVRFSA